MYVPNRDIRKSFQQQIVSMGSVDAIIDIERHCASVSKARWNLGLSINAPSISKTTKYFLLNMKFYEILDL